MSETATCPFCNVHQRILMENDTAVAVLSNPRKVPGHTLVLPKRHIEKPWELSPQELADIFELIFSIEQKILGKLGDGVDIRQNYRPFKKQDSLKVNHLLFHVVPRAKDDYIYAVAERFEKDLFAELDGLEKAEVTKIIEQ